MQLFFAENLSDRFILDGDEAAHLIRVLRKKVGDQIHITNGKGKGYIAEIISVGKKDAELILKEEIIRNYELKIQVHLAVAPTKNNDRFEWMIEKATELGVTQITPLICDRSERRNTNQERLFKTALAAMKQSGRFYLPKINADVKFRDFKSDSQLNLIAHCEEKQKSELTKIPTSNTICILIGPEGDFSPSEIETALSQKIIPVSLGESRLRTETAAIYAMSFFRLRSE